MKTWIKTFDNKHKIDKTNLKWCLKENFNGRPNLKCNLEYESGLLKENLAEYLAEPEEYNTTKIYIIHNGIKNLGWGMVRKNAKQLKTHYYMCYIKPFYRRKGLATKLLKRVSKDFDKVKVYSTDVNYGFYESFGMTKATYVDLKNLK
jgi:ribosomal protein S18 acetylase RimI-like enzyme